MLGRGVAREDVLIWEEVAEVEGNGVPQGEAAEAVTDAEYSKVR